MKSIVCSLDALNCRTQFRNLRFVIKTNSKSKVFNLKIFLYYNLYRMLDVFTYSRCANKISELHMPAISNVERLEIKC